MDCEEAFSQRTKKSPTDDSQHFELSMEEDASDEDSSSSSSSFSLLPNDKKYSEENKDLSSSNSINSLLDDDLASSMEHSPRPIRIYDEDDIQPPKVTVVSPKIIRKARNPTINSMVERIRESFYKHKSSSTSSLYTESTISAPDMNELIKCMSTVIYWNIKNNENVELVLLDIFSEIKYPLSDKPELLTAPHQSAILYFIDLIFKAEQLCAECGVMCMAYIDRLLETTNITLHASNWRRIVLGALMLASKVWEDQAVWNCDFLNVFPNLTVNDLNQLERQYLLALQFNVSLSGSVYAKYYFELKALSQNFPLKPLTSEVKKKIEEKSAGIEARSRKISRTKSVDWFVLPPRPHIID